MQAKNDIGKRGKRRPWYLWNEKQKEAKSLKMEMLLRLCQRLQGILGRHIPISKLE